MGFVWSFIIRGIIRVIAGAITNKSPSTRIIVNVVVGLVGSAPSQALLGPWGPDIAGTTIVPSLIGAIILVLIVSFFTREL